MGVRFFDLDRPVTLFSPEHLAFLALAALFSAVVIGWGGRLGQKGKQRLLVALWAVFTVIELTKYVRFVFCPEEFDIRTGLPFHLCSISLFTYPLAVFTHSETFRNFIYAVNMPGAFFALVTPDIGNSSALSFYFVHLMVAHTFIALIPLYMVVCGVFRPNPWALPKVAGMFAVTMIPALLLNRIFGSNYYFINGPVRGTLTQQFADWCGESAYLLPMLALVAVIWALLYAPFFSRRQPSADEKT